MKRVKFRNLPIYQESIRELISSNDRKVKVKTKSNVLREFEQEKWGCIYNNLRDDDNNTYRLDDIENLYFGLEKKQTFVEHGNFFYTKQKNVLARYLDLYLDVIKKYNDKVPIVELGAGFGSKIIAIAERMPPKRKFFAADLTTSGQNIMRYLSKVHNIDLGVGYVDFEEREIRGINIPKKSIIFTSYSLHYLPKLTQNIPEFFMKFEPSVIINFEPCFEAFDTNDIYYLLCRRYSEENGYAQNILSTIQKFCSKNNLNFSANKNVLGDNPLLPATVIEWGYS